MKDPAFLHGNNISMLTEFVPWKSVINYINVFKFCFNQHNKINTSFCKRKKNETSIFNFMPMKSEVYYVD